MLGAARAHSLEQCAAGRWAMSRPSVERTVTNLFHLMYYGQRQRTWKSTTWMGTKILKCPLDTWIYQELLVRIRPDVILETGTNQGGSAYYMASICDQIGTGRIVTVDIDTWPGRPQHERITYLEGSSTSPEIVSRMTEEAKGTVMVILDSDHSRAHVLDELNAYSPLVTPGSYLIVEDTDINGHPTAARWGPGPMEALDEFLPSHPEFRVDPECEKFFLTFNPRGYLQRTGG
jgi:cephalosporin hydroxylase